MIRRTLGLKDHVVKRVTEKSGKIAVEIVASERSRPLCSSCGRKVLGYDTL